MFSARMNETRNVAISSPRACSMDNCRPVSPLPRAAKSEGEYPVEPRYSRRFNVTSRKPCFAAWGNKGL